MMKAYGQTARTVFVIDDDRVVRSTLRRLVGSLGLPREGRRRSRLAAGEIGLRQGLGGSGSASPLSMRAMQRADGRSWLPRGP